MTPKDPNWQDCCNWESREEFFSRLDPANFKKGGQLRRSADGEFAQQYIRTSSTATAGLRNKGCRSKLPKGV